jgi:hypothetical protein
MEKAEAIVPAIQLGLEIGLTPMSALQNVAVINGRPGIYGDAALALVRASGKCESYTQNYVGEGEHRKAVVVSKRVDSPEPITSEFGVADAKRAGLWGKQGPWSQYPDRMLLFRARGFNLRDNFGDILKGLHSLEELRDTEKPVEARVVSAGIEFGPSGIDQVQTEVVVHHEHAAPEITSLTDKPKRHRRTKAEMEAAKISPVPADPPAPESPFEAPRHATPLEGLRNMIKASPITEEQYHKHLVTGMYIEPHQTMEDLNDEWLLKLQGQFMADAQEILGE